MSKWEDNVRKVVPYTPGEQPNQPDMIKLNTNENPYPPAPGVAEALKNLKADDMRLYSDPTAGKLVEAIAEEYGVKTSQVFVGVGSDDVIAMAFQTFFNSDKPILFPDITYSFYDVWADCFRIPYKKIPLSEDFEIIPADYEQENGGVIFPNPNAPTGALLPLSEVEAIIAANRDVVVMVDEAYIDFGGESALPLLEKYDNLLVVQTFSKSRSMAGARLGFAVGNAELIRDLNTLKYSTNPYNVNRMSAAAGVAALREDDYYAENARRIMENRDWTIGELRALGFEVTDSRSNFIFARTDRIDGGALYRGLKERGILVRHFDKPRISAYVRITVGTREQMEAFLRETRSLLEERDG